MENTVRIFFSVGEPSGDVHGANLIRQLQRQCPGLEAVGYGGPNMAAAGCRLQADLTALAVMWLARALWNLPKFWDLVSRADRYFRHQRPDAVVLIDYPGFNWWIARRAKAHGIPVFYYTPPQIWAWAQWRAGKMRRLADHILCSLPFEEAWLRERGCRATYVGHPFFDEVGRRPLDERFLAQERARPGPLVLILPGSRGQEVAHNIAWFLKAAALVHQAVPEARFAVGAFKQSQAEMVRQAARMESRLPAQSPLPLDVHVGRTPELMHLADCCMACSGSVSLELLHYLTPTVILYFVSRSAYFVQGFFRKVKHITLVNLLAAYQTGEEIFLRKEERRGPAGEKGEKGEKGALPPMRLFPEYLTCEDRSAEISAWIVDWLKNPPALAARVAQMSRLKEQVGHSGASQRAAEYILRTLRAGELRGESRGLRVS